MIMMSGDRSQLLLALFFAIFYLLLAQERSTTADGVIMCKESERQALLEFNQSLRGYRGTAPLRSWDTKDCCAWEGVKCNNLTGYVEELKVDNSLLVGGKLSPSLLKLQHLSSLNLSNNYFNGSLIPDFIGSFKNLRHLDLSSSNFRGPIPSQLGNLSMLETLYLGGGNIFSVGNLEWLSHLSSLKNLNLSFANLSKASDWLQVVNQLPLLTKLVLRDSALPSVSSSAISLVNTSKSLNHLDLSGNNLTSSAIYPWLFNVSSNLVVLDLSRNQLKGPIPESFGKMIAMEELYLSDNQLEGEIHSSFWNMCSLGLLDMESNSLSAFGSVQNSSLCTGYSLRKLILAENQLKGSSLLNEITKLSSLETLDLGYNLLNGTIIESIGQLSNLYSLRLAGNSFDKVVISEAHFSNLTRLLELDLSYTSLTLRFKSGWIPPFQLSTIKLCSCKLGHRFPEWLRTQTKVTFLDISAAEISDSLPFWFKDIIDSVTYLNLSFNQISGTWPYFSLTMTSLDVSSNNFSGPLLKSPQGFPITELAKNRTSPVYIPRLQSVNLSKNKFSGSLQSICHGWAYYLLQLLDLSNNLFSGMIPDCLERFQNLKALNLADNNFSGPIPSLLGSMASLEMLSLRGNRLSGGLPSSLRNCMRLKFLDLSDNKLSGKIPMWIGHNLSSLVFLSLKANQFKGKIPHQLCELKYIQILDLSLNQIFDTIPGCFGNFTSMAHKVNLNQNIEQLLALIKSVYRVVIYRNYVNEALLTWKGKEWNYAKNLGLVVAIDLSCNKLTGEIPEGLTSLEELVALNLSRNFLTGKIPQKIGRLRQLQTLDLSRNSLSGSIPPSMSELTFLGVLDLSYNYLSGKIPIGPQLQLFDPLTFSHNRGLCGPPVSPNCSEVEPPQGQPRRGEAEFDELRKWFYAGMGLGFAVGFWGFCGAVFFKRSWRHSYFRFLDSVKDWLYVSCVLLKARLERKIKT